MSDTNELSHKNKFLLQSKKISPIHTMFEGELMKTYENKLTDVIQTSNFKSGENTVKFRIKIPHKSKSSFNSTIMSNLGNVRNYGMSEYHSSSSLKNSIQSWTFKKEDKFNNSYKRLLTESIYNIPDQKHLRSPSMGMGKRYDFLPLEGRGVPGSDNYKLKSHIEVNVDKKKGALIFKNSNTLVRLLLIKNRKNQILIY